MNSTQLKYAKDPKIILAVDFDLTICMSDYPKLGLERKDAGLYLNKLVSEGYGIVINTCREGLPLAEAIKWLHKNNIPYHYINCNFPHLITFFGADCRKISAQMYIDDKGVDELPEWNEIYNKINKKFKDERE